MSVPRAKVLIASCVALAAIGMCALWLYLRHPHQGMPYRDAFASGKAGEWEAFGGTWAVRDGGIRNDSDERGAKLLTGSSYWSDYVLEADVRLLGEDGDAGLIIRGNDAEQGVDSYSGYYAGLRTRDNGLTLGLADHGWHELKNVRMPEAVEAFRWYHLKMVAYGCHIAVSASDHAHPDGGATIAVDDQHCLMSGRVGLRSYSSGGEWRDVRVRQAKEDDVKSMLAKASKQKLDKATSGNADGLLGSGSLPSHVNFEPRRPNTSTQGISSLRLIPSSHPVHATIRGVVTLTSPLLYVQDSTGGAAVLTNEAHPPLKVGDEVRVSGRVEARDFNSVIRDASIQLLWARAPIPPVSVTPSQAATGAFAAMFIEVEGVLSSKERGPQNTLELKIEAGQQSFRAVVRDDRGDQLFPKLRPGSLVRLRGISVVDSEYTHDLTPFVLLMRSSDDIEVVQGPPWWNARHIAGMGVLVLLLAFIAYLIYSRLERWRSQAILEERELLAHEMHDTLAQSFAGLGFQLEAIRNRIPESMPTILQQVEQACGLVRHNHRETRRNIMMLRAESSQAIDLPPMLEHCALQLVEGGTVTIEVSQSGNPRYIPLRISDTLFRIGQEALANSVRHAQPSKIRISVAYADGSVCLTIQDDGHGYDKSSENKGFGVKGMRRRAAAISAVLEIETAPAEGTRVIVTVPLPPRLTLNTWTGYIWKRLHRGDLNGQARTKSYSHLDR
jgi:signal transduction histidine kinase